jgi:predicted Zn-dependent peptidase
MSVTFQHTVLDNGLTIVGEYRPSAVSVATGFFVKAGARDENSDIAGVSHFLEHMMFKGTEKRSAMELTYEMGAIGAQANAFTSEESTVYYMAVLPEYFSNALDLLSDMMRSVIDPQEFAVEKKVILEEIALYQDRPTYLMLESALGTFFGEHPAGNSVLGTIETITNLGRDQMYDYFTSRYQPSNMVLSVSGNFNFTELCDLANTYCGQWKGSAVERAYPVYQAPETLKPIKTELRKADLNRAHVMLLSPGPEVGHELQYEADVLTTIIGDSGGSKIFWELVDSGLADSASIESEQMDKVGVFYGYASTVPSSLPKVRDLLEKVMTTAIDFSEDDLERAKTKTATRLVLQGESSMRRMMSCGFDWMYQNTYIPLDEELEKTKAVTKESIKKLLQLYSMNPTHEVTLLPE